MKRKLSSTKIYMIAASSAASKRGANLFMYSNQQAIKTSLKTN
jgi:hypothetical protein